MSATTATVRVEALVDEGLGNSAYLVDLGDGGALVVDPPRDLRAVRAAAARRGLRIRFAADTHLHADFLSGARQLAHDDGALILASAPDGRLPVPVRSSLAGARRDAPGPSASASGARRFPHRGLVDAEEVDLGGLTLVATATPGHTDEHLAYVLRDGDTPAGVFTGGSLIVGFAARTDLLGAGRAEELARAQHRSLHRLAQLPATTAVWPTHGAGSFCAAPPGAGRTSTIGRELANNPLLRAPDADAFVAALLGSAASYPPYFDRLAERNRIGPAILDPAAVGLAALPVAEVVRLLAAGAVVVDVRPVAGWAAAHVPGALAVPLRPAFATWLGWLVAPDVPLVIVRDPGQDGADIAWRALTIGHERIAGELAGGVAAWSAAGHPTARTPLVAADGIGGRAVLDVRQDAEFAAGHVPGARHVELGALAVDPGAVPARPTVVMCGHGERAAGAASLLERAGHREVAVLTCGPDDWTRATGRDLAIVP